jgi:hypothetical protein
MRVLLLLYQIFSNMCARVLNMKRETHLLATCCDIKSGETLLFVGSTVVLLVYKPVCLSDVRWKWVKIENRVCLSDVRWKWVQIEKHVCLSDVSWKWVQIEKHLLMSDVPWKTSANGEAIVFVWRTIKWLQIETCLLRRVRDNHRFFWSSSYLAQCDVVKRYSILYV